MANPAGDSSIYYVPHNGWYPVVLAAGLMVMLTGLGSYLNAMSAGEAGSLTQTMIGFGVVAVVLYFWYAKVISENRQGLANDALKRSYVWGMGWFIFSEVMFFAAFFGALFYARVLSVAWLGGEGAKGLTGDYLWPDFEAVWPVMNTPNPAVFPGPDQNMNAPGSVSGWTGYLPFYNTVILLTSSWTVHVAHSAIKEANRTKLNIWLGLTVLLGIVFLILQVEEYVEAYNHMGLTLGTGIYGSTFFLLTGFHGFHVTLGTVILLVQFLRALRGHFTAKDCFGFEAASWYWHFVDVVWVGLFVFVYIV
ncbi:MAG: cytochrome c oxidase subunit 3 [Pseudomonadales bacterium]|nr:cytochrome c oxidase subunit 3 [Pseudomonadales bacterium]